MQRYPIDGQVAFEYIRKNKTKNNFLGKDWIDLLKAT